MKVDLQRTLVGDKSAHIRTESIVDGSDDHRLPIRAILGDGVLHSVDGEHSNDALRLLLQTDQAIAKVFDASKHLIIRLPFHNSFGSVHSTQTVSII